MLPVDQPGLTNPLEAVTAALENPIDDSSISSFKGVKNVAIAVNDKTRPVPHDLILPPLVDQLEKAGIQRANIRFIIATGTHLPMQPEEFSRILPESICDRYEVISHDVDDTSNLKFLGNTSRQTPVYVNQKYYNADLKIVVGNIEPHHFMGFSGGVKSASIGLTGRKTINKNHAMLVDPLATIGEYENNPMRQDIEEIGKMIGVQIALNVILNNKKEITRVISGSPLGVMKEGIKTVREISQIQVKSPYDLVVASAGGKPKDINLYQSQKAMTHASILVRNGGVLLIAAACPEGIGSTAFEQFMDGVNNYPEAVKKFEVEGFRVGPHKAFQIARIASRVNKIILVSDMPDQLVKKCLLEPARDLQSAFLRAASLTPVKRIAILPRATNTIPSILA